MPSNYIILYRRNQIPTNAPYRIINIGGEQCLEFDIPSGAYKYNNLGDKDIDVTFNQLNTDGWLGEDVTIVTYPTNQAVNEHKEWIYDCPITTWLDVDSEEGNPSSFETTCKVTES